MKLPVEITIGPPVRVHPAWAEHEIRFTTFYGPKQSSSNVIFLTTGELEALAAAAQKRLKEY